MQKYFSERPDPVEYEEFINEQIRAFDEREQKVILHKVEVHRN